MIATNKVLIIGGSSGMGLEVARHALLAGAQVVIAGRSADRLNRALESLGSDRVEAFEVDIGDAQQVKHLFSRVGALDHLVITAAELVYGPIQELTENDLMKAVRSKFLGPVFAIQECTQHIRTGGSITLTSGIAARRPMIGGSMAAALNSGLEGLGRAMAIELAPVRVNVISPGWTDTPIWDGMPGMTSDSKLERFSAMAKRLPVGRIGRTEDVASAVMFLMSNGFVTGTVMHVDGGHQLV